MSVRPGAVEQRLAQVGLQLLDLRGERRLRHVELPGRTGEVALLRDRPEVAQVVEVQRGHRRILDRSFMNERIVANHVLDRTIDVRHAGSVRTAPPKEPPVLAALATAPGHSLVTRPAHSCWASPRWPLGGARRRRRRGPSLGGRRWRRRSWRSRWRRWDRRGARPNDLVRSTRDGGDVADWSRSSAGWWSASRPPTSPATRTSGGTRADAGHARRRVGGGGRQQPRAARRRLGGGQRRAARVAHVLRRPPGGRRRRAQEVPARPLRRRVHDRRRGRLLARPSTRCGSTRSAPRRSPRPRCRRARSVGIVLVAAGRAR